MGNQKQLSGKDVIKIFETYGFFIINNMNFHVVTLFPEMFESYLGESILARAIKEKKIKVNFVNPRKFVTGKYRKVWPDGNVSLQIDERPYGGGPGMVMMAEPIIKAVEFIQASILKKFSKSSGLLASKIKDEARLKKVSQNLHSTIKVINFSPSGKKFNTAYAKKLVRPIGGYTDIILICGRYEGVDARIDKILKTEQVSIGEYVLTGGELPAMVLIDCISRQVSGVLGNFDSREEERVSSGEIYTRPEILEHTYVDKKEEKRVRKYPVPAVLLSGDHKKIEEWKKSKKD